MTAGPAGAEWHHRDAAVMGTRVAVDLWQPDRAEADRLMSAVMDEYRRIDAAMSTYKPDSELSRLNRLAGKEPLATSPELFELIQQAIDISKRTEGAFDVTYESVGYLYDFRARQRPSSADIGAKLASIDYQAVILVPERHAVGFSQPQMRINLGGIAKGYAVERGAAILRRAGIRHAVLTAGGDTRVIGDRRGQPWVVGVRHPRTEGEVVTRLPLVDEAISTSGDYERYFEEEGVRYHHIINPADGMPSQGVLSATVIGPDATQTDGLSTALFVLGRERGLAVVEALADYEAIIVDAAGVLHYSAGLVSPE